MTQPKNCLRKFEKIETIPIIYSDHNEIKLEINNKTIAKTPKYVETK